MTEYFPIVTTEGDVVGKALRQDCHNGSHILHPVVHLHVFSSKGELYLQRRALHKDLLPGYWDTAVGGHVMYDETIPQALLREVKEEIGITDFTPIHLETYRYDSSRESEMVHVYKTTYDGPFYWNDGEVMDGRFWSVDELRSAVGKNILTPNLEMELQRFGII
jgi:isopentenyldiphosphate isomerase